jgi:hypothetical protein
MADPEPSEANRRWFGPATVLFFAGTSGKFDQRLVRQSSFFFAIAAFLFAAARMLPATSLFS